MLDDLSRLRLFVRIVATGTLTAAARELGLSLPVASKRLAQLEADLGIRLLQRTTRRLTLTEDGAILHARALRILEEVEQAEALLSHQRETIEGLLRITAPAAFGRQRIAPLLGDFQRLHPGLSAQLVLTDVVLDLVDSGMDIAVRFGTLEDSSYFSQVLAPNYRVLCASPTYLDKHGTPGHPAELADHRCLLIGSQPQAEWSFSDASRTTVKVQGSLISNDGEAVHGWALQGMGIVLKSIWDVGDDIDAGRLRRLLPGYAIPAAPLHAVYPHGRHLAPRVRAFIDYMREHLLRTWCWGEA